MKIDLTQISLPLSSENFQKLLRAARNEELKLKELPKGLKDDFNRCNTARMEVKRQQMLKEGLIGQDD